ncbi:MAG: sugar ABC transporter substrate-binding protein [Treponema sp.]|jgi:multiple sugar transport system substrate-binding protein|nr:sugar ABC transporter substrate-binding protein [Treponema sp.]
MKRLFVFVLIFGLAASIFAAGGKQESGGGGPVTIKWAIWDYDLTVYYKPLIDAYQAKNPQVKIETVDLGSADYMTVLGTQLSGGADFDVVCVKDIPGYANLVRQNRLEPLNSYIKTKDIDTSLYGGTTEQIAVNGEVYALPFRSDFWLIFYNKDLFDAAEVPYPSNDITLDEYDALARKVTRGSGANKTYGAHYHTWRSAVSLFGILDGKNTIVDGTYDFLAPYYERVIKEQNDGIVQSYAALKTSGTHYSGAFFNNQIAMLNMGTWFIATQIDKVKTGESLSKNWGLAKYPHPAGVPAGTTLGTITSIGVNRNSKNKDAALDFMRFVSGPEGAAILAKLGTIPAIMNQEVIDAIASIPGFPGDPGSKEALQVYKTYLEMPLHEKSADIEIVLNEAHDAIMTGNSTIAQSIKEMNSRVAAILGK